MDAVPLSRIPSPFANLDDQEDKFMHLINNHTYPPGRENFLTVFGKTVTIVIPARATDKK